MRLNTAHLQKYGHDAFSILDNEERDAVHVMENAIPMHNKTRADWRAWGRRRLKRIEQVRQELSQS